MDYSFNADVAKVYGVDAAVFIHNLYFWTAKNAANKKHFHDGRYWTYNSMSALTKIFPFWTQRQLYRIINKLKSDGVIHIGNYNTTTRDRTQWYALDDSIFPLYQTVKCKLPNGKMDFTEREDASYQTVTPLPDSKPDNNPDASPPISPAEESADEIEPILLEPLHSKVQEWMQYKKERKSAYTPTSEKSLFAEIQQHLKDSSADDISRLISLCMANNWNSIVWDKLVQRGRSPTVKPNSTLNIEEFEKSGAFDYFSGA